MLAPSILSVYLRAIKISMEILSATISEPFVDADHARDQVSRCSVTCILVLLNNTPIFWYAKCQKTMETSTYGSEIVAARIAIEILIALRYRLRMLGANLEKQSMLVGDNMAVVLNTTIPSSLLKKKHQA